MTWTSVRGHKGPVKRADVHRDLKDSNPITILFYSTLYKILGISDTILTINTIFLPYNTRRPKKILLQSSTIV
jgi:hypothetical protein